MMKILSIAESAEWVSKLDEIIVNPQYNMSWVEDEQSLYEQLQAEERSIVCLPGTKSFDVYNLCTRISTMFPLATTLLIFHSEEEFDIKRVLRAGASDVIFLTSPLSRIQEDINHAIQNSSSKVQLQSTKQDKNTRVITVASTKGGVGKTTVAINLAAIYGKKLERIAVVDLDLQFGDIAMFLDVKPTRTIYDWVKENKEGKQIENYMTHYQAGISVLAAPQRPEFAEVISGEDVRRVIDELKQKFDVVIIDTSCHMNENMLVALENSDDILVMTYLDLPTLKNSKMLLDTLTTLQLGGRTKVVLNREVKVKGLTIDMVEKVLGKRVFITLPLMAKLMVNAVNEGRPISYSFPKSPVSKKLSQMAETLLNVNHPPAVKLKKDKQLLHVGGQL